MSVVSLAKGYDVGALEVLAGDRGAPHATACVPVRRRVAGHAHAVQEIRTRSEARGLRSRVASIGRHGHGGGRRRRRSGQRRSRADRPTDSRTDTDQST